MASSVTISDPEIVALILAAAERFTAGDATEAVALALRRLQGDERRTGTLFGRQRGSVTVRDGVDLTAPILEDAMDAETGPVWPEAGNDRPGAADSHADQQGQPATARHPAAL